MARSIVLRFDATCHDCGRALSAGTTARWFGKGRVSCCGGSTPPAAPLPPSTASAMRNAPGAFTPARDPAPAPAAPARYVARNDPSFGIPEHVRTAAAQAGVPAEALFAGMSPEHVTTAALNAPGMLLLIRLQSGARLISPAEHARHVIGCIEESCRDKVRDVTRLSGGELRA